MKNLISILILFAILILSEYAVDWFFGDGDGIIVLFKYLEIGLLGILGLYFSKNLKAKFLRSLVFTLSLSLILIVLIETVFYFGVNYFASEALYSYKLEMLDTDKAFTQRDTELGYNHTPNSSSIHRWLKRDSIVIETRYEMDSNGLRLSSINDVLSRNNYALFMGGSFTFGYMLQENETMASVYNGLDNGSFSYNLGVNNFGTQHLLAYLKKDDFRKNIKEKDGFLVYTFIDHHVRRAIGDQFYQETNDWFSHIPYYSLEKEELVYKGKFGVDRKEVNYFYKLLDKSNFLRYFGIKFPLMIKEFDLELTGRIIDEAFKVYQTKFNNDNFYVMIYPGQKVKIGDYISNPKIKILDYSNLLDLNDKRYFIPGDLHPSAISILEVITKLDKDINQQ